MSHFQISATIPQSLSKISLSEIGWVSNQRNDCVELVKNQFYFVIKSILIFCPAIQSAQRLVIFFNQFLFSQSDQISRKLFCFDAIRNHLT